MLPWWLNPWGAARDYRAQAEDLDRRLASMAETARMDIETIQQHERTLSQQTADLVRLRRLLDSTRGQLSAAVTGAKTSGAALSTAEPEFVLAGIPRGPGLGKRLMASRNVTTTAFAMTEENDPPPRWKIGAILDRLLVIDKPSYGEALAEMAKIWRNWDRDAAIDLQQHQQPGPFAGIPLTIDPALPPGIVKIVSGDSEQVIHLEDS